MKKFSQYITEADKALQMLRREGKMRLHEIDIVRILAKYRSQGLIPSAEQTQSKTEILTYEKKIDELKTADTDKDVILLQCRNCKQTQPKGEWERRMDLKAKMAGMAGFVNLSAKPECLKCGSKELHNVE